MTDKASRALMVIRACVGVGRFRLLVHFRERLAQRGLLWSDVLAVLDEPTTVESAGDDDYARPRWLIAGDAADGLPLEFLCVLDQDADGAVTVFVTIYPR